ncbi:MAG: hypothetical protein HYX78_00205 [Armatimonadetes bacterium]|nr:hypothetical protein [Armatimonadota bacterium]
MARKRSRKRNILLEILDVLTDLGLKLGGLVFIVVLGYLVYGLAAKNGLGKLASLPPMDRDRVVSNVALGCSILRASGAVVAVCAAIRYYVEETLGYLMSILGVVLYFGMPWGFTVWFSQAELHANPAIATIVSGFRSLGTIMFLLGVFLIVRDLVLRMVYAFSGRDRKGQLFLIGEAAEGLQPGFRTKLYPQCWETHYCRDFVRKVCPAYQNRKPCWRIKVGCFCDEGTILRAMNVQSKEGQMFARDLNYRTGSVTGTRALTAAQKRTRCRTCVIFLYHQHQKYKLISPIVFPVTAALMWLFYPNIVGIFEGFVQFTDQFMRMVSFLPQTQVQAPELAVVPGAVQILFVMWLAIMIVSYALQFIEYCIFRLQV